MPESNIDAVRSVESLLSLVLIVLATIAIAHSPLKVKAVLHILAGMAVGLAVGIALGAPSGSGELSALFGWQLMCCGGIWVSVRKIRRAASARRYGWPK